MQGCYSLKEAVLLVAMLLQIAVGPMQEKIHYKAVPRAGYSSRYALAPFRRASIGVTWLLSV